MAYPSLELGSVGKAVEAAKRAHARAVGGGAWRDFAAATPAVRRVYGPFFVRLIKKFQKAEGIPVTGRVDPATWSRLAPHLDAKGKALLGAPAEPDTKKYIQPYQGFGSLHAELWEAYTEGRMRGFLDGPGTASGTYANKPGDHGYWPSWAFDLDIVVHTGQKNVKARAFFDWCVGKPWCNYVILGNRIWSRERGEHEYTAGGHENHIHVSGIH